MITAAERRALRARAHPLKPVILLGQHGVTSPVLAAIDEALTAHELIKVRLRGIEKEARAEVISGLAVELGAEVINLIGHVLTLFRAAPVKKAPAPPARKTRAKPAAGKVVRKKAVAGTRVGTTRASTGPRATLPARAPRARGGRPAAGPGGRSKPRRGPR